MKSMKELMIECLKTKSFNQVVFKCINQKHNKSQTHSRLFRNNTIQHSMYAMTDRI